jgi:hypothetical protein
MPRILLSTAHITPLILTSLDIETTPPLVAPYPPLPSPFHTTVNRVERLQRIDAAAQYETNVKISLESAKKPFCVDVRNRLRLF